MAQIGLQGTLWRGTAGTQAATKITNIKDAALSLTMSEADTTTRAADGWSTFQPTLKNAEITGKMLYITGDADLTALQTAFLAGTALAFYFGMGDGVGLDCDGVITQFNIDQTLTEAMTVDITIKPTYLTRKPQWITNGPDAPTP